MRENAENAIHYINRPEEVGSYNRPKAGTIGFTSGQSNGQPMEIETVVDGEENPLCYAKMVVHETPNTTRDYYYIRASVDGILFDPWGAHSEGREARMARHMGRRVWDFKKVSPKAFEFYLKYLISRNPAWYKNAVRESYSV